MILPECYDCTYKSAGYPCRTGDGRFNFVKAGRAIVAIGRCYCPETGGVLNEALRAANDWVSPCEEEILDKHADMVLELMIAASNACETPHDASFVAAGLIENAVGARGPELIDRIEMLARQSAKFRYILSGIWGESHTDPDVWQRISRAVGEGGRMDCDGRAPWDGRPVTVLDEAEALLLMQEDITSVARKLGLVP